MQRSVLPIRGALLAAALLASSAMAVAREQAEKRWELAIVDGTVPANQRLIKAQKGERLRWQISSNQSGDLHLHAYRLHTPVQAGKTVEMAFTAHATGKFRLEWHGAQDKALPKDAAPGQHHAAPLATLEVRPR
jgi:hypothetical protein